MSHGIHVYHLWAPRYSAIQTIVTKAVAAATPAVELYKKIQGAGGDAT